MITSKSVFNQCPLIIVAGKLQVNFINFRRACVCVRACVILRMPHQMLRYDWHKQS